MTQSTYTVQGLTCSHCVASVTEEIDQLDGVQNVEVDLTTGKLTVTSDRPVTDDEIRGAVTEEQCLRSVDRPVKGVPSR